MLAHSTFPLSLKQLATALGGDVSGISVLAPGPGHKPKDRSLSVTIKSDAPDGFMVHSLSGDDDIQCKDYVRDKCNLPPFGSKRSPDIHYIYRDANGESYVRVTRTAAKAFYQSHWTGSGWKLGTTGIAKIPYRLPEMLASPDEPIFVVEGEKDADKLSGLGLIATTATEGAGKWREPLNKWFAGRTVYVLADNDKPGLDHANTVGRNLTGIASSVAVVELIGLPPKGDVSDWLHGGGTAKQLLGICEATAAWTATERTTDQPESTAQGAITATPFVFRDPASIPIRDSLYAGHFFRGYVSLTLGPGGSGKSNLEIVDALAIASDCPLIGHWPAKKGLRVWYINLEDPLIEIERRFAAARLHHNVRVALLAGNLFVNSGRDQDFVVMRSDGKGSKIAEPVVEAMIKEIIDNKIDVLIVDPFISTHEVNENDNSEIQQVVAQFVRIAHEANIAVELVHHVNKSAGDGKNDVSADSSRGASSLKDKARSVRTINTMSVEEASAARIAVEDRFDYFRIGIGKANLARRSGHSEWRKTESVYLNNSPHWSVPGDTIGVVTEWEWPSKESIAEQIPADQLAEIKRRVRAGNFKANQQSTDWAGYVFAAVMEMDINGKGAKKPIVAIMAALVEANEFKVVKRHDGKRREEKEFFEAA